MLICMLYIFLKSLLIGWIDDSVPCVLYIGPCIDAGGTMLYEPDFLCKTVKPKRSSSLNTFLTAFD